MFYLVVSLCLEFDSLGELDAECVQQEGKGEGSVVPFYCIEIKRIIYGFGISSYGPILDLILTSNICLRSEQPLKF